MPSQTATIKDLLEGLEAELDTDAAPTPTPPTPKSDVVELPPMPKATALQDALEALPDTSPGPQISGRAQPNMTPSRGAPEHATATKK
ncbi:MAG: hypothetical protein UT36_C0008G0067 [Candidatus Peregrinibacteria bacterium GW2011_GWF2_39_17]|nr:MAG: hypothetical protein UT36_C0008G0067 [Candidatus Peregrinibacteria bacterium GW2011_GWF2_39_17]HCW32106.1 hypothetical protein [Candidatus Peregrinibacteria bacterium]